MLRILFAVTGLFFLVQSQTSTAQDEDFASDVDTTLFPTDFFDQSDPLEIILAFDIKKYKKEKSDEEYLPAKLTYTLDQGLTIEKNVRVRARGEYRRNHCFFPPYWLNIKKSNISNDNLADVKKIKVVSHCKDSRAVDYEDYLIREYLIYKMYNIITDYSFKVRLLEVTYIDSGPKNKTIKRMAFMIEPEINLAERLDSYALEMDNVKFSLTDSIMTATMSIFQYMIGNTDYSVSGRHNLKLLTPKDYSKPELIPVPYDFDFSGIVDAFYANPRPELGIGSVTDRYFYGLCRSDNLFSLVLEIYREKKDEIFQLLETFEPIDKKSRKEIIKYIDDFYEEIEEPDFIANHLQTTCE